MRIDVTCLDLTTGAPVPGVRVTCTVRAAPRVQRGGGPDKPEPEDGGGDDRPPIIDVVDSAAVTLRSRFAVADVNGIASFSVDVSHTFEELAEDHAGDDFVDVVGFVRLRGEVEGLDQESPFVLSTSSRDSATGDVDLDRIVTIDFAKSIVGHTTEDSCRLWFQLHGLPQTNRRYECVVVPDRERDPGEQTHDVIFDEDRVHTAVIDLAGLAPGQAYQYQLLARPTRGSGEGRVYSQGSFRTVDPDRPMTMLFGSCFKPLDTGLYDPFRDLQHWRRLGDHVDGDVQLFLGDQIYGDEIPEPEDGERWLDGYVRRYNAFWAFQPLRRALARRPTYMITDDHEVKDDWGTDDEIPRERIEAGVQAFRTYQLAHSPIGYGDPDRLLDPMHYRFRRGPVAFFMMDGRTQRGTDSEYPIFGEKQWRELTEWARSSEAQDADIIVFGSPVPVALLPIEDLREAAEHKLEQAGILAGAAIGAAFGPVGAVVGATVGAVGAEITYQVLEKTKLETSDYLEMWTLEANQPDMTRLLNVLFNLANDTDFENPDRPPGTHPRAVVMLGGDCHFGLIHVVASDRTGGPDHSVNPQMLHLTSSAIGRPPQDSDFMRALFNDIDEQPTDFSDLVDVLRAPFAKRATRFVLDSEGDEHYRAAAVAVTFERNLGRLEVERLGDGRRYRIKTVLEGETDDRRREFEVDLDARPVAWHMEDPAQHLVGNPGTHELHDLSRSTPACQVDEIKEPRRFFRVRDALDQDYDGCGHCLPEYHSR